MLCKQTATRRAIELVEFTKLDSYITRSKEELDHSILPHQLLRTTFHDTFLERFRTKRLLSLLMFRDLSLSRALATIDLNQKVVSSTI
jgi:hypothetical protein